MRVKTLNAKNYIKEIITKVERGQIPPEKAWAEITKMKNEYIKQYSQQSWNSFIGHNFEKVIYPIIKSYLRRKKSENPIFSGLDVLTESELKSNDILVRKLAVRYGDFLLLPDVDIVIVDIDYNENWRSEILAICSCKTSLRERIAQACYWKLKLVSSDSTRNVRVFLVTTDNDDDFSIINKNKDRFDGKHRNRIIAEYELDGIYILKDEFPKDWESEKVKHYEAIFDDIVKIFKEIRKI